MRKAMFFNNTGYKYTNLFLGYSLRNIVGWSNAVLKIRRSSDNTTAWIFFNGKTITLSSLISTVSNTTPSATTLQTWIGNDDGFVEEFIPQTLDNVFRSILTQITTTKQPRFIENGLIFTKNNRPAIDFLSDLRTLEGTSTPDSLTDSEDSTILCVGGINTNNSLGTFYCSSPANTNRFVLFIDSRISTPNRISLIQTLNGSFGADLLTSQDSTAQRLLSVLHKGTTKFLESYFNGVFQSNINWSGVHTNDIIRLGAQHNNLNPLNGNVQEFLVFDTDKTLDSVDFQNLNNDVLNYYSI